MIEEILAQKRMIQSLMAQIREQDQKIEELHEGLSEKVRAKQTVN